MLLVLYFILQYSLYYNKNTEKNQTCISQLEWFQTHLSIQSNISTACISQTHNLIFALHKITNFSSFNYHQKLNGNQNFYKIPVLFFFFTTGQKVFCQWVFSLFLTKYHSKHCSRPSFVLKPKHENVTKETTQIMIFLYLKVDDNPSTRPTIYRLFSQIFLSKIIPSWFEKHI